MIHSESSMGSRRANSVVQAIVPDRSAPPLSRRGFLIATSGLLLPVATGTSLALVPSPSLAASEWMSLLLSGARSLFEFLFGSNSPLFTAINRWLNGTPTQPQTAQGLHGQYSYQAVYNGRSDFHPVRPGTYAGVNRLPQFSIDALGEERNDLNWAEIDTVTTRQRPAVPSEVAGQQLIRGYVGERRPFVPSRDESHFRQVVLPSAQRMQTGQDLPRDELDIAYLRDVCTCNNESAVGYAFRSRSNPNPLDVRFRVFRT